LSLIFALVISSIGSAAEKQARVAILPFAVHAEKDLSFLRQGIVDMLSSRIAWEDKVVVVSREEVQKVYPQVGGTLSEKEAREIGHAAGADYVLFGSLTAFGDSVSIDAKMTDVSGSRPTLSLFNQSQNMNEVIPRINQFAEEINAKVFDRKTAVQALAAPRPPVAQQKPSVYENPEKLLAPELRKGEFVQEGRSPFVMDRKAEGGRDFYKSPNIAEELRGLALADVDGDGKNETIVISASKVLIFRMEAGRFLKRGEYSVPSYREIIGVDAADIKEDGRAEIFVTCVNTNSQDLDSFVLEWQQDKPVQTASGLNWYFRVLEDPLRGRMLIGQKRGATMLFVPGIYELQWAGAGYEAGMPLEVPGGVNVYGLAMGEIQKGGGDMVVAYNKYDRIRLLSPSGGKDWESKDSYGGSETFLEERVGATNKDDVPKRFYLSQRLLLTDLNRDGQVEVVTVQNFALTGRAFERFRHYSEAQFNSFSWDGLGLTPDWHTRKISGYVSDFAIGDFDNDGSPDLVAAVVTKHDPLLGKPRSSVIAYDLQTITTSKKAEGK